MPCSEGRVLSSRCLVSLRMVRWAREGRAEKHNWDRATWLGSSFDGAPNSSTIPELHGLDSDLQSSAHVSLARLAT